MTGRKKGPLLFVRLFVTTLVVPGVVRKSRVVRSAPFLCCLGPFANRKTRPEGSDCISATTGSKGQSSGPGTGSGWSRDSFHCDDRARPAGGSTAPTTHNMRLPKELWLAPSFGLGGEPPLARGLLFRRTARLRSLRFSPDSGPHRGPGIRCSTYHDPVRREKGGDSAVVERPLRRAAPGRKKPLYCPWKPPGVRSKESVGNPFPACRGDRTLTSAPR